MLLLSRVFSLMTLEVLDDSSSPPTGDVFYFLEVSATHPTCPCASPDPPQLPAPLPGLQGGVEVLRGQPAATSELHPQPLLCPAALDFTHHQ